MTHQHSIRMTTRDGIDVSFDCAEDEDLLTAAARAELVLPSSCRQGGCGACRGNCGDGDYHLGEHSLSALSPADREQGEVLLCRTYPRSDLTIALPFDRSAILSEEIPTRMAEIMEVDDMGGNTRRLLLRLLPDENNGLAAEFEPGQFMELVIPGGVKRAYSLSNTGNWNGHLEFLIRLRPDGAFSNWLGQDAQIGQTLQVRGPLGTFTLKENGMRPRWFVGGGTGLAPLMSMLRRMAEWQEPHPTRLYFGVTHETEIFATNELQALQTEMPGLMVETCVWHAGNAWSGFVGSPADALRRDLATCNTAPDIYLCGPPALITAAEDAAREANVPSDQVFAERFLAS